MKKTIIVLMIFSILSISILPNVSAAAGNYDHDRLLEYDGYAEAMYESIVEQTTFISGRYTENKDYVNESINQITDYAKGWWNEYKTISELPPKEKIREMINAAGGYALTVSDFIKNLFTDKEQNEGSTGNEVDYQSAFSYCLGHSGFNIYATRNLGCEVKVTTPRNGTFDMNNTQISASSDLFAKTSFVYVGNENEVNRYYLPGSPYNTPAEANQAISGRNTFNGLYSIILQSSVRISVKLNQVPINPEIPKRSSSIVNNYIKDNPMQIQTPQPTAYLSCPDGTRINMKINGGTFLDVKGNIMSVDKNGTATIDSQICNLGWEKPKIQYIDGTDQVGISTPDKGIIDAETGETIIGGGDSEFDDEIEDGCGTLCAIGKMLKGLGDVAKAIAGLATKILEGLVGLFVPASLDFVQEKFDETKAKFEQKFAILNTLMDVFGGLSAHESENILMNYTFSLPITGDKEYKLFEFEAINNFIPYMKRFVSGILIMYTLLFVYRKIVGNGGVMEK